MIRGIDGAPTLRPEPNATWGLHLSDVNLALGDLLDLTRTQSAAWLRRHRV